MFNTSTLSNTVMNKDYERITAIQKSLTTDELSRAMSGYVEELMTSYPALQTNQEFLNALETSQFMRALHVIRRSRQTDENEYFDLIRVLEFAESRRLAIWMNKA